MSQPIPYNNYTASSLKNYVDSQVSAISSGYGNAVQSTVPQSGVNTYNLNGGAGTYTNFLTAASTPLVLTSQEALQGQWQAVKNQGDTYWTKKLVLQIADGSITVNKTNFITPGQNLFNQLDIDFKSGFYVNNNNGTLLPDSLFSTTGYVPVTAGLQYTFSYKNSLAWYDANKVFISGNASSDTNKTQTAVANAKYVRATIVNTQLSSYQIVQGNTLPAYVPFSYVMKTPEGINIAGYVSNASVQTVNETAGTKGLYTTYAPKLYTVANRELAIYYENVHKFYDAYQGKSVFDYTATGITGTPRNTDRSFKITPTGTGTIGINFSVANEAYDLVISFALTNIIVSDITKTTAVNVINLGDSYTQGSIFVRYLRSTGANTGLTFSGIKQGEQAPENTIRTEGRGGYKLSDYFVNNKTVYNPFMQPTGSYLYYGNTSHWIDANSGSPSYLAKDYPTAIKSQFSASTGYKISPNTNDVIYDNAQSQYFYWNGTAWTSITEATLAFSFNFAKYRQAWSIAQPNILHVMLGTNDWSNVSESQINAQWASFKTNMDALIASVKADSPNCKFALAICPSSGRQGNLGNLTTEKRKRAYWINAKNMITTYSNREGENLYVVDYHTSIDREYAFGRVLETPFNGYTGTLNTETYVADPIHINIDGYSQMGTIYAAIIQQLR